MGGFDVPILHGMCFYGLAAKGAIQSVLKNNSSCIRAVQARFTGHVFPGESIRYLYWIDGNKVLFQGSTVERKTECIVGVIEIDAQAKL